MLMVVFFFFCKIVVSFIDVIDCLSFLLWWWIVRYIFMWFIVGMIMNMVINVMENINFSIEDRSN